MSDIIAASSVENDKVDWEARALKAEAKIVADKKAPATEPDKPQEKTEGLTAEDVVKLIAADRKEQAIQSQEKTFETNQAQTNSMSISSEPAVTAVGEFKKSIEDYDKLSANEQREYYKESMDKFGAFELF